MLCSSFLLLPWFISEKRMFHYLLKIRSQYYCHFPDAWGIYCFLTSSKTLIILSRKRIKNDTINITWAGDSPTSPLVKRRARWRSTHECAFEEKAYLLSVLYSWFTPKLEELSLQLFALLVLFLTWYQQASSCTIFRFTKCGNSHSLKSSKNKEMETLSLPQ